MSYYLISPTGHRAPVTARMVCVGSDPTADIRIDETFDVLPKHFWLRQTETGMHLMAPASERPVYVNGEPAFDKELHSGDAIRAGHLQLIFDSDEAPETSFTRVLSLTADVTEGIDSSENDYGSSSFSRIKYQYDSKWKGHRHTVRAGDKLERMTETMHRCNSYIMMQGRFEQFGAAMLAGLLVAVACGVLWSGASSLSNLLFYPIVGCVGQLIGLAIRHTGNGFGAKFALLAGIYALGCGLVVNSFGIVEKEKSIAMKAAVTYPVDAGDSSGYESYGYFNAPLTQQMTDRKLDIPKTSPTKTTSNLAVIDSPLADRLMILFHPRQFIAYGIAFTLAVRCARRRLTLEEAIMVHCG